MSSAVSWTTVSSLPSLVALLASIAVSLCSSMASLVSDGEPVRELEPAALEGKIEPVVVITGLGVLETRAGELSCLNRW